MFIVPAMLLTACASQPMVPEPLSLDAALRQPCPPVPHLADGTKGAQLLWNREMIRSYDECARRHEAVVAAWPKPAQ